MLNAARTTRPLYSADATAIVDDVAAIVVAMTDGERPFLHRTVKAILADPGIGQVVLCVEQHNDWVGPVLGDLTTDPRLGVVPLRMALPGAVRNRALAYVTLPWVAYCDGDDVWCVGKTRLQRAIAAATGGVFVGADHCLIDEGDRVCAFAPSRYMPMPSAWLVKTEIMRQHPFDETLAGTEDGEWWVRTAGRIDKVRLPKTLLQYRVRAGSLSSRTPSKRRKAIVVSMSAVPIVRQLTLVSTWLLSAALRRREYVWRAEWGSIPPARLAGMCDGERTSIGREQPRAKH
jgi:hypothetical protein